MHFSGLKRVQGTTKLLDAEISTVEYEVVTKLRVVLRDASYSLQLPEGIGHDDDVTLFKAVIDEKSQLATQGDYVKYNDEVMQDLNM